MCNHVRPGERWDARYVIPDDKAEAEWNCKVLLKPINAPTKDN